MKTFTLLFVLVFAASVAGAHWAEGESMLARKAAIETRVAESAAVWSYAHQAVYPAGRFS